MRRFLSAIALLALLLAQGPFAPCPAAATDASHDTTQMDQATSHQHHAASEHTSDGKGAENSAPADNAACTMVVACQWVAVPAELVRLELIRPLHRAAAAPVRQVPATTDIASITPPPRTHS